MSEDRARREVRERSGGICEICNHAPATSWSHRVAAGRGGQWDAANGIDTCGDGTRGCHGWLTANPAKAYAGGWHVETGADPSQVPVWLARPWPGWFRITDPGDGGAHVLVPVDAADLGLPETPERPGRRAA